MISKKGFRHEYPDDFARSFVKFIYDNLEKPLIMPTEAYLNNSLMQLKNFGDMISKICNQDHINL